MLRRGRILAGGSPLELIEQYTLYSGRMRPLPQWITNGSIIGYEGGTAAVRTLWKQLQEAQVPVSAFWLQVSECECAKNKVNRRLMKSE